LADREQLRVRSWVLPKLALVVSARDHLPVADEHRADRHVVVRQRALRFADGQEHEVLVKREEALTHASS
jgi:hypothetical protein